MIISRRWLGEFIDLNGVSDELISDKLTQASCEVETVEQKNCLLQSVIISQILSIEPHPSISKLQLVLIDVGDSSIRVVCSAQNICRGNFVVYAPDGSILDDGSLLKSKNIGGIDSFGMLCSEKELGISDDHSGLCILDKYKSEYSLALGTSFAQTFGLYSDVIYHIDNKSITHRGDLWGVVGMARELAAILGIPFNNPYDCQWRENVLEKFFRHMKSSSIHPEINTNLVLSYALLELVDVDGRKESPLWLRYRLFLMGIRSINALVDISNYVMLELGIPNHIYDASALVGNILNIYELNTPQAFTTLDGVERGLLSGDIVIADEQDVQIIAGIMGGQRSMVNDLTSKVVLEAAVWDAASIRKTSLRLALRTESSSRYEKSLDPHAVEVTLLRLAELIVCVMPQSYPSSLINMVKDAKTESVSVLLTLEWIVDRIGLDISYEQIIPILQALGYVTNVSSDGLWVQAPSFRFTKAPTIAEDILEEIIRIYGFNRLNPQAPSWSAVPQKLSSSIVLERQIQDFLVLHAQAFEVMTHPLIGKDMLEKAHWHTDNEQLKMLNSTNIEHDRMRPTLMASLLKMLKDNSNHLENFKVFELGRVHYPDQTFFNREEKHLAVLFYSSKESTFMSLQDSSQALMNFLGYDVLFCNKTEDILLPLNWLGRHPYEHTSLVVNENYCGSLNAIHPLLLKEYKIKGHATVLILNITQFSEKKINRYFRYQSISRYPNSRFDSTWILTKNHKVEEFMRVLRTIEIPYLQDYYIFDAYVPADRSERHITIRSMFGSPEKTLDAKEIKQSEEAVMNAFEESGYRLKQ